MADDYIQQQARFYAHAVTQQEKDNILYRMGTHLEVIPCDGATTLTPEQRLTVLNKASEYLEKLAGINGN